MSYFVFFCWLFTCIKAVVDQLPRLGKRELICLLLFACNYVVSVGEVSSSSGCLRWATLFDCGTPLAFHIIICSQTWRKMLIYLECIGMHKYNGQFDRILKYKGNS